MTRQEQFIVVVIEPLEQPLLLEDTVPPGCIQHLIPFLMKNKYSREICDVGCNILKRLEMNDEAFRKPTIIYIHNSFYGYFFIFC